MTTMPNAICQNCHRPAYLIAGVTESRCRRKIGDFMCDSPIVPHNGWTVCPTCNGADRRPCEYCHGDRWIGVSVVGI